MITIKLADLAIRLHNRYEYTKTLCRDYVTDEPPVITLSVSDQEIAAEGDVDHFGEGYLESIALYRKICTAVLSYDAFLLHAAVLSVDGKAFAFSADSGVGKTTHLRLWQERFGDRCTVINGDKPLIRIVDGKAVAYGTPWSGKEGLNKNTSAVLTGLCFLDRGKQNRISRLSDSEAIPFLFSQILLPETENETARLLKTLNDLLLSVPCYRLFCTPTAEAVTVAWDGMNALDSDQKR